MDSGSNRLNSHIPATVRLAGQLLRPDTTDQATLAPTLKAYELECGSDQASLAGEFAPYFYYLLHEQNRVASLPNTSQELLRHSALQAASTAIARRHIIGQIGERLAVAGIGAILLKGAAMDRWAYPDQGFRLGSDIDLLVRESDYCRVDEALAPLAEYQPKYPGQHAFNAFAVEKPFYVASPCPVYLDVHRNLSIPKVYALDLDALFARARPHPAEPLLLVMSPEDNLLHFAVHAFYDMQLFSKQTIDAYRLIDSNEIDWEALANNARQYRMVQPLAYFLYGLRAAFGDRLHGLPREMGNLSPAKRGLVEQLLLARPAALARRGPTYRVRQLCCQLLLSGNIGGYLHYNIAYVQARLKA